MDETKDVARQSLLEQRLSALLATRQAQSRLRSLKSSKPGSVDFSSNDFLSLSSNPAFQASYLELLNNHLTVNGLGSTGSRLLDGNSAVAEQLEAFISTFHGAETGLLTNSGFDANVSIFTTLPQKGDVVVFDELVHASVHDGMRASRAAKFVSFKHNDVHDLRRLLDQLRREAPTGRNVFVAVESVYSMEGDLAPLTQMVEVVEDCFPRGEGIMVVDEAHATGCYGHNGKGRVSELGLEQRIQIRLHTFGKALGCNGAIILCSSILRQYLINYARPLIYTTFMSYPSLLAIKNAYTWLQTGRTTALAGKLDHLVRYMHEQLQSLESFNHKPAATAPTLSLSDQTDDAFNPAEKVNLGSTSSPPILTIPGSCPESPIFALVTTQPRSLATHCQKRGFVVRAVVPPTVPIGTERVRVCLHAGNTESEIKRFVACVRDWLMGQYSTCDHGESLIAENPRFDVGEVQDTQLSMKLKMQPFKSPESPGSPSRSSTVSSNAKTSSARSLKSLTLLSKL